MTIVMVLLGGAIGAPLRYLTDFVVQSRHDSAFPWGTLTVNVLGSLVAGISAAVTLGLGSPPWVVALVVTGFCGALTTFSTFGFETVRLLEEGLILTALANCAASLMVGLGACAAGLAVAAALV